MISLGFVSTAHIHFSGFAREIAGMAPDVRVVAVWDDDEDRGRRNAKKVNAGFVTDIEAIAARSDIDGFVVCAPNNRRLDLMRHLIPSGRAVMCEKPLALSMTEAQAIQRLVEMHGTIFTTGFFRKAFAVYHSAAGALASGAVGRVTHIRVRNAHDGAYRRIFDDPDVAWMTDPEIAGGGGALDMGSHALHLLAWLFGPAEEIWATIANRSGAYPGIDDHGIFQVALANGAIATAEAGWIGRGGPGSLEIFGTEGMLRAIDTYDPEPDALTLLDKGGEPRHLPVSGGCPRGVARLLAAMEGRVGKEDLAAELEASVDTAAMMEAAYKSNAARTWQPVASS